MEAGKALGFAAGTEKIDSVGLFARQTLVVVVIDVEQTEKKLRI